MCNPPEEPSRTPNYLRNDTMLVARLLLSALLLLSSCSVLWCLPVCVSRCCKLVENFPNRLRRLRENYRHIQDFYVSWTLCCCCCCCR